MSNKTNWLMLIVFVLLVGCMSWLVAVSLVRNGTGHQSEQKTAYSGLKCGQRCVFGGRVVLQPTKAVQKTQSASALHELSVGVEMTPLEMLRNGAL